MLHAACCMDFGNGGDEESQNAECSSGNIVRRAACGTDFGLIDTISKLPPVYEILCED